MDQIRRAIYTVAASEKVIIEIEATKVGNFASFVLDGESQKPVKNNPLTYEFTISVGAGDTHFGMFQCFFPADAPDDANFQVFLQGSKGKTTKYTGSDIKKTDPIWRRGVEFRR